MDSIWKTIDRVVQDSVRRDERIAIYLSGGLDSTILLSHLTEHVRDLLAVTLKFYDDDEDVRFAKIAANFFAVEHIIIEMGDLFEDLPEILRHFDRPRFNVWPYYLAKATHEQGLSVAFCAEGGDENFGYSDRSFLTGWANNIAYVQPAFKYAHKAFNIDIRMPFTSLPWKQFLNHVWEPNKATIRDEYKVLIPNDIFERPSSPPSFVKYRRLYHDVLSKAFPDLAPPEDDERAKFLLQLHIAKVWAKVKGAEL